MLHVGNLLQRFLSTPEHRRALQLVELWTTWDAVLAPDLAQLAKPLGHKDGTLFLGVEDAIAMQEVSLQIPAILHAVNAALGEPFFDKIRLDLLRGRTSLDAVAESFSTDGKEPSRPMHPGAKALPRDAREIGMLGRGFSRIPALERCYQAYVRLLKKNKHPAE